jgi:hypothetical protein
MKTFKQFLTEAKAPSLAEKFDTLLKQQNPLTPEARQMMDDWMGGFSMEINDHLRGRDRFHNPSMDTFVKNYDKIIQEHGVRLEEPLTVYRSTPHSRSIRHTGFLSATLDPRFAIGVAAGKEIPEWEEHSKNHKILRIVIPKRSLVMPVDARHTKGRELGDYSREFEILLPRGTHLDVNPKPSRVQIGNEFRDLHDASVVHNMGMSQDK